MTAFNPLCVLPLQDGEGVSVMTVWEAMGRNVIVLATTQGRMYLIRVDPDNALSFAGPLEFVPAPAVHLASKFGAVIEKSGDSPFDENGVPK